jgi:acetyl-CoA carboxylase biotin carboxyl carrier protein
MQRATMRSYIVHGKRYTPTYAKVGDKIKAGQTVCIVEAMKIMNEIQAEFDCEILEVLVENGQAVEFDTPLFKVKRV